MLPVWTINKSREELCSEQEPHLTSHETAQQPTLAEALRPPRPHGSPPQPPGPHLQPGDRPSAWPMHHLLAKLGTAPPRPGKEGTSAATGALPTAVR